MLGLGFRLEASGLRLISQGPGGLGFRGLGKV